MLAESVSKAASGADLGVDDDRFEAMIKGVNDDDEEELEGKRAYRRVRPGPCLDSGLDLEDTDEQAYLYPPPSLVVNIDPHPKSRACSVKPTRPMPSTAPKKLSQFTSRSYGTISTLRKHGHRFRRAITRWAG